MEDDFSDIEEEISTPKRSRTVHCDDKSPQKGSSVNSQNESSLSALSCEYVTKERSNDKQKSSTVFMDEDGVTINVLKAEDDLGDSKMEELNKSNHVTPVQDKEDNNSGSDTDLDYIDELNEVEKLNQLASAHKEKENSVKGVQLILLAVFPSPNFKNLC